MFSMLQDLGLGIGTQPVRMTAVNRNFLGEHAR
jgi:hypothetical protein